MAKVKLLDHFLPLIVFFILQLKLFSHIYDFIFHNFLLFIHNFFYEIMIYQIMHSIKLLQALNLKAIFKNNWTMNTSSKQIQHNKNVIVILNACDICYPFKTQI